jgi:hypothetical protein
MLTNVGVMRQFSCLLVLAVALSAPGCGASRTETQREERTIDEVAGSYRGAGVGDRRAAVSAALGEAVPLSGSEPLDPLGGGAEHGASGFLCKGRAPGPREFLRYEEVVYLLDGGEVCGWILGRDGSATRAGVAIGDPLADAEAAYPGLVCDEAHQGDEDESFPYCAGRLEKRRYIWFGGDPIDTIQMNSEHY